MKTRAALLRYRLAANHLSRPRLSPNELVVAAAPGLQDGSPRSALLSLAARVDGLTSDAWRDQQLTQVFGPRGAVYVVPRHDAAVFTLGLLPRDPARLAALRQLADEAHTVLDGAPMRQADLVDRLPGAEGTRALRWAACLGTLHAVWDTVDTLVVPVPEPGMDPETARLELARRFFRHLGPANAQNLRWWLDGRQADANTTIDALSADLVAVEFGRHPTYVAADTAPLLAEAPPPHGVLMLPPDDVYISRLMRPVLVPDPDRQRLLWPQAPPPGAMIVDGNVAGTWRRRRTQVTVTPWQPLSRSVMAEATEIVAAWPLPGPPATVNWERHV